MTRSREASSVEAEHKAEIMPTFLIVGAGKSGTTSLYSYLRQHPDIYMPLLKEPEFFAADEGEVTEENGLRGWHVRTSRVTQLSEYQALFKDARSDQARGEASAVYLYLPEAAGRIKRHIPNAKILVILRNPVERAYSAYLHHVREGLEDKDFATALSSEPQRIAAGWSPLYHYRKMGFYHEQLTRYYDAFGVDNVHTHLYDDLREDPAGVTKSIFAALGVHETFVPDFRTRHNISGVPKSRWLHRIHHFLKGSNQSPLKSLGKKLLPAPLRVRLKFQAIQTLQERNLAKPSLQQEVRLDLLDGYNDDIRKLQGLLGRDLSHWLKT